MKNPSAQIGAVAGFVLLGGVLLAILPSTDRRSAAEPPRDQPEIVVEGSIAEELRRELAAARRDLIRLEQEQARLKAAIASLIDARAPAATAMPEDPEHPEHPEDSRAIAEDLELRLAREVRDAAWSDRVEADLKTVTAAEAGSRSLSIECQSTLCRMEVEHADFAARERFIEAIFASDATRGGTRVEPLDAESGAIRSVFYIGREGYGM